MIASFDYFNRFEQPTISLRKPNDKFIGFVSNIKNLNINPEFNAVSEMTCDVYEYGEDNEKLKIYDDIKVKRQLFVEEVGFFIITECNEHDDNKGKYKSLTLYSCEHEISYKKLTYFNGTYKFWDASSPKESLMGQILNSLPRWSIGHVDETVAEKYRTFDESDTTIYSFLMDDVEESYECLFEFDIINRIINVYDKNNYIHKTSILLTKNDVIESISVNTKAKEIFTALSLYGDDEITYSGINPLGGAVVYNFDYYKSDMSEELQEALNVWEENILEAELSISSLRTDLSNKYTEKQSIQSQIDSINEQITLLEKQLGVNTLDAEIVSSLTSQIKEKRTELSNVQSSLDEKQAEIDVINAELNTIHENCSFENNFTTEQLSELDAYIFECSEVDDTFAFTDDMTYEEQEEILVGLYNKAKSMLVDISTPTEELSLDSKSFIFQKEFLTYTQQLNTGVIVDIEDGNENIVSYVLLKMDVNYQDKTLELTFGNKYRSSDAEALWKNWESSVSKSSTTLSYERSKYGKAVNSGSLDKMNSFMKSSLDLTLNQVKSSDGQSFEVTDSGIKGRRVDLTTGQVDKEQIWLTANSIVFTDDAWESIKTAIGRLLLADGTIGYGVNAEYLIGKMILGNNMNIANEKGSVEINEGITITTKHDGTVNNALLVQRENEDGTLQKQMHIDSNGNIVLTNGAVIEGSGVTVQQADGSTMTFVDYIQANSITAEQIEAIKAEIMSAVIKDLSAEFATIEQLNTLNTTVEGKLDAKDLEAEVGKFGYITADDAVITDLEAGVGKIDTLIFGSAGGSSIQTEFSNSVIAQLGDAQIKSAMIEDMSVDKLKAGTMYTDDITIASKSGNTILSDNTLQFSDDTRVRIQIGKDASDDYSINLWDKDGNLMLSEGGITDAAIKDAIIRNDMISDDANISGKKLDIDSLFSVINDDGSHTFKSSKIYFDEEEQTLDVVFKSMNTNVESVKSSTIYDVDVLYALSDSSTVAPTEGWTTSAPSWVNGKYMWQKTVTTHGDGTTSESTPTCITGAKGADGTSVTILGSYSSVDELNKEHPNGNLGDGYMVEGYLYVWNGSSWENVGKIQGDKGADGIGVSKIQEQYYLSSSNTTQTGGSWSTTSPTWKDGYYIWTRSAVTWTNNTTTYTTPVLANALNSANSTASDALNKTEELETTVTSQGTEISAIQGQIDAKIWQQDINDVKVTNSISGTAPLTLDNSADGKVIDISLVGATIQEGTPSSDNVILINNTGDCVEMEQGYYSTSDGSANSSSKYIRNKRSIPCNTSDVVKIALESSNYIQVIWYNENGFVSSESSRLTDTQEVTVPSGATSFNFNILNSDGITPDTSGKITLMVNGKYVLPIKTVWKNLFDKANATDGYAVGSGGTIYSASDYSCSYYTEVMPNENYSISNVAWYNFYTEDRKHISQASINPFVAPSNAKYVRLTFLTKNKDGVQLESGTVATEIVPYTEHTEYIYLTEPLRQDDSIVKMDGVAKVKRIIAEDVIDGTQTIVGSGITDANRYVCSVETSILTNAIAYGVNALCSHFKRISYDNYLTDTSLTGFWVADKRLSTASKIYFAFPIEIANNTTTVKAWFAENPVTVQYEVAEEYYEELDTASQIAINNLETFDGVTHLSVDSRVQPASVSAKYYLNTEDGQRLALANDDTTTAISKLNTQYTDISIALDGIDATVAKHTTQISEKADGTTVSEIQSQVTSLEADLDGYKTTVSSTYATKTEFNALEIGGKNLILGSGEEYTTNAYRMKIYTPSSPLVEGETYTISLCVTPADNVTSFTTHVSGAYGTLATLYVSGAGKQILSTTFVAKYYEGRTPDINISFAHIYLYRRPNDGTVTGDTTIHWIKVEKGNKSTDWTPAPEDVESEITAVSTRVSTAESSITQLSTEISMKVDVDGVIGAINLTSEEVLIQANKINLVGAVKAQDIVAKAITAEKVDIEDLFAKNITATDLHVTGSSTLQDITANNLTITGNSTFSGVLNGATGSFSGIVTASSFDFNESVNGVNYQMYRADNGLIIKAVDYNYDDARSARLIMSDGGNLELGGKYLSILSAGNITFYGGANVEFANTVQFDDNITLKKELWASPSSGECEIGVKHLTGAFSMYGNVTTGTRGLYDTVAGYVVEITDSGCSFKGNADTATNATTADIAITSNISSAVLDCNDDSTTTFAYSKAGLTSPNWLAAWNGYELRAISPANVLNTIGALPLSGGNLTGNVYLANGKELWCRNASGTAVSMVAMDASNIAYLGYGKCSKLLIGNNSNTTMMQLYSAGRIDFLAGGVSSNSGSGVSIVYESSRPIVRPTASGSFAAELGSSSYRWLSIYSQSSLNVSSDRRLKNTIMDLDDRYIDMMDLLMPKSFYLNNITDGKRRLGYIAQDVEESALSVGLTLEECGFINKDWVEREDYVGYEYGLNYDQLAVITHAKIKRQDDIIQELNQKILVLEAQVLQLQLQQLEE